MYFSGTILMCRELTVRFQSLASVYLLGKICTNMISIRILCTSEPE